MSPVRGQVDQEVIERAPGDCEELLHHLLALGPRHRSGAPPSVNMPMDKNLMPWRSKGSICLGRGPLGMAAFLASILGMEGHRIASTNPPRRGGGQSERVVASHGALSHAALPEAGHHVAHASGSREEGKAMGGPQARGMVTDTDETPGRAETLRSASRRKRP
jgi:hypothetical protein